MSRWLFLALLLASSLAAHAARVVDDRGVAVELARPPQRIVTMLPSLTETVCTLGGCDRLVGVDEFSNWPASVNRLPRVGGVDDARVEIIVALKPDLVLLSSTARALPRLQSLGVPVLGLDIKTLADVQRVLGKVGEALQLPGAPQAWARLQSGIDAAAASVPAAQLGTRVYFEVGGGYAASASSHIGELLARLGAVNVVPGHLGSVPQLNPEFVVRADPQLMIVPQGAFQGFTDRPGFRRIAAVRDARVCVLPAAEADTVMRPGPRLAEAAQVLAGCLGAAGKRR